MHGEFKEQLQITCSNPGSVGYIILSYFMFIKPMITRVLSKYVWLDTQIVLRQKKSFGKAMSQALVEVRNLKNR